MKLDAGISVREQGYCELVPSLTSYSITFPFRLEWQQWQRSSPGGGAERLDRVARKNQRLLCFPCHWFETSHCPPIFLECNIWLPSRKGLFLVDGRAGWKFEPVVIIKERKTDISPDPAQWYVIISSVSENQGAGIW